jgi:hypothetical protein
MKTTGMPSMPAFVDAAVKVDALSPVAQVKRL